MGKKVDVATPSRHAVPRWCPVTPLSYSRIWYSTIRQRCGMLIRSGTRTRVICYVSLHIDTVKDETTTPNPESRFGDNLRIGFAMARAHVQADDARSPVRGRASARLD
ncbi:hypothetical protein EVAR_23277_1 [Eumeta japonica]|uniref:Uncharacterized protein n=1 Tax=Eumeta variegata TaxID=151549 RepID=A0A4C1V609_EUMVA|nr:hypothetical protein EVAR_23277_1 [Eumeta japonica]